MRAKRNKPRVPNVIFFILFRRPNKTFRLFINLIYYIIIGGFSKVYTHLVDNLNINFNVKK